MKKYVALLVLVLGVFVVAYLGSEREKPRAELVLRIGVECDYVPNNWEEKYPTDFNVPIANHEGYYADGYDIQIAKAVAEKLDASLEVKKIPWNELIPALQNGEIDAVFSGMLDTQERRRSISFTETYEVSRTEYVVIVNTGSPYAEAKRITDFSGAKFTAQKNTNLYSAISQIPGAVALPAVETVPDMLKAVTTGQADASVINIDTGRSYETSYKNIKVIRFPENEGFKLGFSGICAGLRKDSKPLITRINDALGRITKSDRRRIMDSVISRILGYTS